jgi:Lrp/AsnC family leucine-responsive transcriptional regulator
MTKLDVYDKKILEILLNNSREQISAIGKKVRLRRENVNYKINRLIKEGLIKEFNTILNEKNLGLSHYVIFLELVNLKKESEQKILEYLKESQFTSWSGVSAGKWSLIFDIFIPKDIELNKVLNDFLIKFGAFIEDYVILNLHEGEYFGSKLLGIVSKPNSSYGRVQEFHPDKIDLRIISLLNKNSRMTLVEISEKVGLTPNGVNNRIKILEKTRVIMGYTISLDWKKIGYEWYGLQLKLSEFGDEIDKRLKDYFRGHPNIIFYYRYLGGSWDYDLGIIVKNSGELREVINDFRNKFSDTAKIADVFIVLEEATGYKLPKGVFELNK